MHCFRVGCFVEASRIWLMYSFIYRQLKDALRDVYRLFLFTEIVYRLARKELVKVVVARLWTYNQPAMLSRSVTDIFIYFFGSIVEHFELSHCIQSNTKFTKELIEHLKFLTFGVPSASLGLCWGAFFLFTQLCSTSPTLSDRCFITCNIGSMGSTFTVFFGHGCRVPIWKVWSNAGLRTNTLCFQQVFYDWNRITFWHICWDKSIQQLATELVSSHLCPN